MMANHFDDVDLKFPIDKFIDKEPLTKEIGRVPVAWRFRSVSMDPNKYWGEWALVPFDPSLILTGSFQVEALYNE